jgi:hypothetical protein
LPQEKGGTTFIAFSILKKGRGIITFYIFVNRYSSVSILDLTLNLHLLLWSRLLPINFNKVEEAPKEEETLLEDNILVPVMGTIGITLFEENGTC